MRKSRYTDEQIIGFIRQDDAGMGVADLCRKEGFSSATFYKWRANRRDGGQRRQAAARAGGREHAAEELLAPAALDNEALKVAFGVKR